MKNTTKNLSVYQNNTIDITTVNATSENKVYLVDKRLVDFLLAKVAIGSLDDIKNDIITEVHQSITKEELFTKLDNYIYLDKVLQLVNPVKEEEEVVEKPVAKASYTGDLPKSSYTGDLNNMHE